MNSSEQFDKLYSYVVANPKASYEITFDDNSTITAFFDTAYETDNSLEMEDPNYEEFWALLFTSEDKAYEITYKNMPAHVTSEGNIVI